MSYESLTRSDLLEKVRDLQEALEDAEAQNNSDRARRWAHSKARLRARRRSWLQRA